VSFSGMSRIDRNPSNLALCGICEKQGAEIFWYSPLSQYAHERCVKMIEPSERILHQVVGDLYNKRGFVPQIEAHIRAIQAVRQACGNDTIYSYFMRNGENALAHLFNTIGIRAAQIYPSKL